MGTPGDKTNIGKVVTTELHQQSDKEQQEFTLPVTNPPFQQTLPGTSSEMGVIQRLPQFQTFSSPTTSLPHMVTRPVSHAQTTLEQATIEDYFAQSKYPTLYQTSVGRPKTFLSILDQPGPSGLHTPKGKPTTVPIKVKKSHKPPSEQIVSKKAYSCHLCQKNFASQEKLTKHQQSHLSTSPYKCDHCRKVFSSKFKLVRHALIHSDRKPFCCTVCDRTFHRKDHLKNHVKVHSPQKELFTCEKEICRKQYTSLLSYKKHLAIHAAEEGNLECQICSERFETKEGILYHLKIHAGSRTVKNPSEKKFNCDYCGRKFFTKKDVRRHLVVHTGLRDFLCQFCPQRFGRKDHLVRHIKKSHHAQYRPPEETVTTATIKKEVHETKKTEMPVEMEIKTEIPEGNIPTVYSPDLGSLEFLSDEFLLEQDNPSLLLPATSEEVELNLGSGLLEEMAAPSTASNVLMSHALESNQESFGVVFSDPALLQSLLQPTEEKNIPLPGFSQTFQPPPPPGPPPQ